MEVELGIKRNAVICILKNENKLLLLKRKHHPNKGLYTPVGGKIDPFENPIRTAARETWEETGITVNNFKYSGSLIETSPTKYNWNNLVYTAEIAFVKAPSSNEGELTWIGLDEMGKIPTPPTDAFIYDYVLSGKHFFFNAEYDESLKLLTMWDELSQIKVFGKTDQ